MIKIGSIGYFLVWILESLEYTCKTQIKIKKNKHYIRKNKIHKFNIVLKRGFSEEGNYDGERCVCVCD